MRVWLAERWGVSVPMLGDQSGGTGSEEEVGDAAVWRASYPVGDLSGDGLSDVLSVAIGPDRASVEALSGQDGARLWRHDTSPETAWGLPVGDLTGDGADDLLVWHLRLDDLVFHGDWDCPLLYCTYGWRVDYRWTVGLRSGSDGRLLWSKDYPGVDTLEVTSLDSAPVDGLHPGGPDVHHYDYDSRATNALVLPFVADGRLVLNRIDEHTAGRWSGVDPVPEQVWVHSGEYARRMNSRAELVDPVAGTGQVVRAVEDAPVVGLLEPLAPDRPELVWSGWEDPDRISRCAGIAIGLTCTDSEWADPVLVVELLDQGLEPLWRLEREKLWHPLVVPLRSDLDGTGVPDLAIYGWTGEHGVEVIDGLSGEPLWSRRGNHRSWVVPAGDLGGSGQDVFVSTGQEQDGLLSLAIERVTGASGETLFTTHHMIDDQGANPMLVWLIRLRDVNGDGGDDFGIEIRRVWHHPDCVSSGDPACWDATVHTELLVEGGRTGQALYHRAYDHGRMMVPSRDLDGDGAAEFFERGQGTHVVSVARGELLWSAQDGWLMAAGDQSGDGVADAVLDSWTTVSSLAGATGTPRWTVGFDED